jgi:serine protease Do
MSAKEIEKNVKRMATRALVFGALVSVLLSPSGWSASLPDVVDQVRSSIVGVGTAYPPRQPNRKGETVAYRGTGFVVGNGRQVITNAHVIPKKLDTKHNQSIAIFAGRGAKATAYFARVLSTDTEHDLALLEFKGKTLPAMQLADSSKVREGQDIAFTGFPIGVVLGLYPVTHRGMIAAISPMARPAEKARTINAAQMHRLRTPFDVFQLDATAYPGNSGSPVYVPDTGRVVGIINSVLVKGSKESMLKKPSGISYAIPAIYIHQLLSANSASH